MRVQLIGIADRGLPGKERLHLRALANLNVAQLLTLTSRYGSFTTVTSGALFAFWFPAKDVKAGDNIILYHWGFPKPLWQDPLTCAVVFDVLDWQTTPANSATPALAQSSLSSLSSILAGLPTLQPPKPLGS
jgi:hypothetical protein